MKETSMDYNTRWSRSIVTSCAGNFHGYTGYFARFHDIYMDRSYAHALASGGENVSHVIMQRDSDENYSIKMGFFKLQCPGGRPKFAFLYNSGHVLSWWKKAVFFSNIQNGTVTMPDNNSITFDTHNAKRVSDFTIILTRNEYANVYWTIIDIYNVFLLTR